MSKADDVRMQIAEIEDDMDECTQFEIDLALIRLDELRDELAELEGDDD